MDTAAGAVAEVVAGAPLVTAGELDRATAIAEAYVAVTWDWDGPGDAAEGVPASLDMAAEALAEVLTVGEASWVTAVAAALVAGTLEWSDRGDTTEGGLA